MDPHDAPRSHGLRHARAHDPQKFHGRHNDPESCGEGDADSERGTDRDLHVSDQAGGDLARLLLSRADDGTAGGRDLRAEVERLRCGGGQACGLTDTAQRRNHR